MPIPTPVLGSLEEILTLTQVFTERQSECRASAFRHEAIFSYFTTLWG